MKGYYAFKTKNEKSYETNFSPKEIAKFQCFDAYRQGESEVLLAKDVDFTTFYYVEN